MLKKLPQDQLEDESIGAVSTICRSLNWGFVSTAKDKSGIDAEIEVVHGIARTGLFLKCQLKAGRSYVSSETDEVLRLRVEAKYLRHWHGSNVQIVLLFYDPLTQNVYWKDIRDYLRVHPKLLTGTQETRIVEFDKRFDLLTPESLPVLEEVAKGDFHYGFISLQEQSAELAFSNRFLAQPLPAIWVAPTWYENRVQVRNLLTSDYSFTVNNGLLYSFVDIRKSQCELGGHCNKQVAAPRLTADVPTAIVTELLNLSRDITMFSRGLDVRRDRFFFPISLLSTPSANKFRYTTLQGRSDERTLIYSQVTNGKPERKHHAVRLSFAHESGRAFLQIEPDWFFTFPQRASFEIWKSRMISEKANLHNKDYLYLLHFWRQYLSNNTDRIRFLIATNAVFGTIEFSSSPQEFQLPFRMQNDYFGPKRQNESSS